MLGWLLPLSLLPDPGAGDTAAMTCILEQWLGVSCHPPPGDTEMSRSDATSCHDPHPPAPTPAPTSPHQYPPVPTGTHHTLTVYCISTCEPKGGVYCYHTLETGHSPPGNLACPA